MSRPCKTFKSATLAELPEFGNLNELAKKLGIMRSTLVSWRTQGAPFKQIGSHWYYERAAFVAWLETTGRMG